MARLPDVVVNKTAENVQNCVIAMGVVLCIIAFGAFSNDEPMAGVVSVLIGFALFGIASKIKTKKRLVGGTAKYR